MQVPLLSSALVPLALPLSIQWPAAEWYLEQLAASDQLLHRLHAGPGSALGPPLTAAEQLSATLGRLGLTAAELAKLASGEVVSGESLAGAGCGLDWGSSRPAPRPSTPLVRAKTDAQMMAHGFLLPLRCSALACHQVAQGRGW